MRIIISPTCSNKRLGGQECPVRLRLRPSAPPAGGAASTRAPLAELSLWDGSAPTVSRRVEIRLTRSGRPEAPERRKPRAMFAAALRGNRHDIPGVPASGRRDRRSRRRRWRRSLAACGGGESSSDANEPAGTYEVKVVTAEFPTEQRLGQTSLLQLGVRNTGEKTVPALTVTVSIAGKEGQTSSLPFGIRDPQPGLAQPDRPVWVLAERLPETGRRLRRPGRRRDLEPKTFDFGPLKPGETTEAVWKLSAVEAGTLHAALQVDAGLGGEAKAETAGGVAPGGSFAVRDHRGHRRTPKSPTAAKSSKSKTGQRTPGDVACRRWNVAPAPSSPLALALRAAGLRRRRSDRTRLRSEAGAASAGKGVALKRIGDFDEPGLRRPAPRASRSCCSWSSRRARSWSLRNGRRLAPALPRHLRAWSATAASAACSRSPSRPTTRSSGRFYVYYTDTRGDIRVDEFKRRSATRAARRLAPRGDRDPPPDQLQPQRRPAAVPRRPPLLRHRRRRLRRRPAEQRPEQGQPARQAAADRPARPRGGTPYSVPADNPFVGTARARRDLQLRPAQPVPLLLRHGRRAEQPRIAIGDVGQNRFEELDYTTVGRGERRQLRLGRLRGLRPLHATRTAARPTPAAPSSRSSPTATAAAAAARSSAATSSATGACRRSAGATSTPTSARASCAASSPT